MSIRKQYDTLHISKFFLHIYLFLKCQSSKISIKIFKSQQQRDVMCQSRINLNFAGQSEQRTAQGTKPASNRIEGYN